MTETVAVEGTILRQHFVEGKSIQAIAADLNAAISKPAAIRSTS